MKKPPKKPAPKWDTHVYLSEDDRTALLKLASREDRSLTKMVTLIIRDRLALERV